MAVLRVSSRSNPNAVAGAFAGVVRDCGRAEVNVVGAGALNQAVKAVAIARTLLATQGIDLVCVPSFAEIEIDGQLRTALHLVVEARDCVDPSTTVDPQLGQPLHLPDLRVEHDGVPRPVADGDGDHAVLAPTSPPKAPAILDM